MSIIRRVECKSSILRKAISAIALVLCVCFLIQVPANAAGSISFASDDSMYRPYSEWYTTGSQTKTAGIPRRQIIYVYAEKDELICMGSSEFNTQLNSGNEIECISPSGTVTNFNVTQNGEGHISTRAMEVAGPNYPGLGNTGGYTPLTFTVSTTGVWEFHFMSYDGDSSKNPAPIENKNSGAWKNANSRHGVLAAWDVTVVKNPTTSPEEATGRAYTHYLSLNGGSNSVELGMVMYVLTTDGYIYKTTIDKIKPYGFIFFANNRGLVNADPEYNMSLYASAFSENDNTLSSLASYSPVDGSVLVSDVQFHSPFAVNTELDQTFKIFFEEPSRDLPQSIFPTPYAPGTVTNFKFVGYEEDKGVVGQGGFFDFFVTRASSFQIKMTFGEESDNNVVVLSNTCVDGENRIYWDGKDAFGAVVPAGKYGSNSESGSGVKIKVELELKAGEYHFPLLDVEGNPNGVKIELVNIPLDSDGKQLALTSAEKSTVYYNNSTVPLMYNELGAESNKLLYGVDTSIAGNGAAKFASPNGDYSAVDIWTYYKGDANVASTTAEIDEFELVEPNGTGMLIGEVYYDMIDSDGAYNMINGDYPLLGVKVELLDASGNMLSETVTDYTGKYSFSNVPYSDTGDPTTYYTVRATSPITGAVCTTHNPEDYPASSAFELSVPLYSGTDIDFGFHYTTIDKQIKVNKIWTVDKSLDFYQPDTIMVTVEGRDADDNVVYETTKTISAATGWAVYFAGLPKYKAAEEIPENLITYHVKEEVTDIHGNPLLDYYISAQSETGATTAIIYDIINTPKGTLFLKKVDSADSTVELEGAEFELYRVNSPDDVLIGTYITDYAGRIVVRELPSGSYYFKEVTPPASYALNSTSTTATVTLDNSSSLTSYAVLPNVTNDYMPDCDFTLTKTLTAVSSADQTFVFEITCGSSVSYATVTIPANTLSSSISFSGMPGGSYTIRELDNNWRYSVVEAQTEASDGVNTYPYSGGVLSMQHINSLAVYEYTFTNELTKTNWLSATDRIVNIMSDL